MSTTPNILVLSSEQLSSIVNQAVIDAVAPLMDRLNELQDLSGEGGPFTLKVASQKTGISVPTFKQYIQSGLIKKRKLGGNLVLYQSDLNKATTWYGK